MEDFTFEKGTTFEIVAALGDNVYKAKPTDPVVKSTMEKANPDFIPMMLINPNYGEEFYIPIKKLQK